MITFAVCTTCFRITDTAKKSTQRCQCEKSFPAFHDGLDCPSGNVLCYICATTLVGGYSRWSWNACENCKVANKKFHFRVGFTLPLGRHSVMNGVSIQSSLMLSGENKEFDEMLKFVKTSDDLYNWGILRTRELYESVPEWSQKKFIPIDVWQKKFESSLETSLDSFARFYGVKDAKEFRKRLKKPA